MVRRLPIFRQSKTESAYKMGLIASHRKGNYLNPNFALSPTHSREVVVQIPSPMRGQAFQPLARGRRNTPMSVGLCMYMLESAKLNRTNPNEDLQPINTPTRIINSPRPYHSLLESVHPTERHSTTRCVYPIPRPAHDPHIPLHVPRHDHMKQAATYTLTTCDTTAPPIRPPNVPDATYISPAYHPQASRLIAVMLTPTSRKIYWAAVRLPTKRCTLPLYCIIWLKGDTSWPADLYQ